MSQGAPHPRMHGISHVSGGPDPIPGLLPSAVVGDVILSTLPGAYYKLNETTGVWHDSSGADRDATYIGRDDTVRGVPASFDEGDNSLCVTVAGPDPTAALSPSHVGECYDPYFEFADVAPFTVSVIVRLAAISESNYSMGVCGNVSDPATGAPGWGIYVLSGLADPGDDDIPGKVLFRRCTGPSSRQDAVSPEPLVAGEWYRLTGVFDGTTMGLWINETQVASAGTPVSLPSSGDDFHTFRFGDCGIAEGFAGNMAPFQGELDSIIVWDRAISQDDISNIISGSGTAGEGWGLELDEDGNPVWSPPGVSVEHGDGPPDETPVPVFGTPSGPTSVSGWHLSEHVETCVLYDPAPGRFDVPSMKWTRVPFSSVRIQRQWETTPGTVQSAWLPDDRGLTEQAQQGLLHIGAGMEGTADVGGSHDIRWWFSPEWPFLDWAKLPNFGDPAGVDAYVRAGRLLNASTGSVMRSAPGSSDRRFFEWGFFIPADGIADWVDGATDNPYPIYPVDSARPLRLPDPYPKLSEAESSAMYLPHLTVEQSANLTVGTNLCLQVWQDSPWLIRFSTDVYRIPYPGLKPDWIKRPYLSVAYRYDPETIDHDTGLLL